MTGPETPPAPADAPAGPEPAPDRCPRCGSALDRDQEWCLSCGTAARTTIAATPRWRLPLALLAVLALLCAAALAWAFVELTNNDDDVRAATTAPVTTTTEPPPADAAPPPAGAEPPADAEQAVPPPADPAQPAG